MVDDLLQGLELLAVVVLAGEVDLVVGELVTSVSGDETLGVDEVEAVAGILLGHALADEEVDNLLGNADTGGAGTEENGTLVLAGETGALDSVDDTAEDDSASTLDVVIEAGVVVLVTLQSGERILEVLELNNNTKLKFPLACFRPLQIPLNPGQFRDDTRGYEETRIELTQASARSEPTSTRPRIHAPPRG